MLDFEVTPDDLDNMRQVAIERARSSLLAFTLYTFGSDYRVNWHHRVLCDKLDAFERGDIKRLIISMPPRHGKSELASRRLPAYILGRNPDARIIACSYGADLAKDMSRDAKRIVMGDRYSEVFPDTNLPDGNVVTDARHAYKNTADQWQIVNHRGQYLCRGVGGGITGKGGDYLIVDDPIKDDLQAQSEREREKIWDWYTKVFKTRASKDAGILVIMTRWHEGDLVGRLKEQSRQSDLADQWHEVRFPALYEGDDAASEYDVRNKVDEALWPSFRDATTLQSQREEDPDGFAALYQQRPAPPGGRILKTDWLDHRYKELPDARGQFWWACDPKGGSKDPKSSECVIQLWWRSHANPRTLYLVDQRKGIWNQPETLQMWRELNDLPQWRDASARLVENKGDGPSIKATLQGEIGGIRMVSPKDIGGSGASDKELRLRVVSSFWGAGNIVLPHRSIASWIGDFVHQHKTFPASTRDDMVDTSTMAIWWAMLGPGRMSDGSGRNRPRAIGSFSNPFG
jgi:predicted phage terminase large subunit-like protein